MNLEINQINGAKMYGKTKDGKDFVLDFGRITDMQVAHNCAPFEQSCEVSFSAYPNKEGDFFYNDDTRRKRGERDGKIWRDCLATICQCR